MNITCCGLRQEPCVIHDMYLFDKFVVNKNLYMYFIKEIFAGVCHWNIIPKKFIEDTFAPIGVGMTLVVVRDL